MKFDNSYLKLPSVFFSRSTPMEFVQPELIVFNEVLAKELDFNFQNYNDKELAFFFSGQKRIDGSEFTSQVYAGHQFGHFVPILGDGRAIHLGEVIANDGSRFDLQLKGAGPTAFSRRGDGFSALGPVLREYLVSEFMHAAGIPTTRALAAVKTNQIVYREIPQEGAVFTRVAKSHIRIGSFQYFLAKKDFENLKILLNYCIHRHYPEIISEAKNPGDHAVLFLRKVIEVQVELVSYWMSIGFIHGVMNTDNVSISGETLDYGPCAFMDYFNYDQVYSFIDRDGRYRYSNQPRILAWNLARLADCLIPILCEERQIGEEEAIVILNNELEVVNQHFEQKLLQKLSRKLMIEHSTIEFQKNLISEMLEVMHTNHLDFTNTFRIFSKKLNNESIVIDPALDSIFMNWSQEIVKSQKPISEITAQMDLVNPLYIPRNHLIQKAIELAEQNDFSFYHQLLKVLGRPFIDQPDLEIFATAPTKDEIIRNTFCGT